jgi:tRNA(Leu) C34 or U34 (ribose-2'-O)-methylase TrmL
VSGENTGMELLVVEPIKYSESVLELRDAAVAAGERVQLMKFLSLAQ